MGERSWNGAMAASDLERVGRRMLGRGRELALVRRRAVVVERRAATENSLNMYVVV